MRVLKLQRMVLVPPICLLSFLFLWTSSTLGPLTLSQQSVSADHHASVPSSLRPYHLPDSDLRNNVLTGEDPSSGLVSRTSNEVLQAEAASNHEERLVSEDGSVCFRSSSECFKIEPESGASTRAPPVFDSGDLDLSDFREGDLAALAALAREEEVGAEDLPENRHLQSDGKSISTPPAESPSAGPPQTEDSKEQEVMFRFDNMTEQQVFAAMEVEKLIRGLRESALPLPNFSSDQPFAVQDKTRTLLVREGVRQGSVAPQRPSCVGRYIYMYELPSKFNADLVAQCDRLVSWFNFCDYFLNQGMGMEVSTDERNGQGEAVLLPEGAWHLTHQYALELIFHARMSNYECLTKNDSQASLFYIPFYGGLDVIRWHFSQNVTNESRDGLTKNLMGWLENQEAWRRNKGADHLLVLGKISWDFRRSSDNPEWGSTLLQLPQMEGPAKVLIERNPWAPNEIGVPHPTFFHPKSDHEMRAWQAHCERSERRYLVSFAGMPRPNMSGNVRGHLIQQCLDRPQDCFLLRCEKTLCMRPDSTMDLFLHSHFCMQPPGDSPTRRSVFDSLIGGCIPVLFDPYTAYYQYPWHLPEDPSSFSVYISSQNVMTKSADIIGILRSISESERSAMRARIIQEIIPGLLYSKPGTEHPSFRDAFDISIEGLLQRVANVRAEAAAKEEI